MANETVVELEFDPIFGTRAKKKLVNDAEKLGDKSGDAFGREFKSGLRKVNLSLGKSLTNSLLTPLRVLRSEIFAIGAAIGTGVLFKSAIQESSRLQDSLTGLRSVANAFGIESRTITETAKGLAQDGLIPLQDVTDSLKNLIVNFNGDLEKSVQVFDALKNSAAFNRQGQLSLGEAIKGAAEGLKNDLSIKIDNAGVTKNLSIIQKEYAASIGTSVGRLTEAQKAQAEYVGIIKEASIFQGDYNKLTQTFSGAIQGLQTSFRFLLAAIGDIVTKSPATLEVIRSITTEIRRLTMELSGQGTEGFRTFILAAIQVGQTLNDFIVRPMSIALDAATIFFKGINTGAAAIVATFAQVGAVISDVLKLVGGESSITQAFDNFDASSTEVFKENMNSLRETMDGAFGMEASDKVNLFFENLRTNIEGAEPGLVAFGSVVGNAGKEVAKNIDTTAKSIGNTMNKALGNGVANGIQTVTKALMAGENVFQAFGKAVLNLMADMAIQMGKIFVATGIAQLALFSSPGASILAGAALIAAGTVAKSIFGGGDAGATAGIGGGGVSSGGFVADDLTESGGVDELAEPAEPETKVQVTIQGDVFDSDETGLRISQILEEASLNQNVKVVGAA